MQIGSGRIDPEFYSQRPIFGQFLEQLLFTDQLGSPLFYLFDDGGGVHGWRFAVHGLQLAVRRFAVHSLAVSTLRFLLVGGKIEMIHR